MTPVGVKGNLSLGSPPMFVSLESSSETEAMTVFCLFLDRDESLGDSEGGFRQRKSLGRQKGAQAEGGGQGDDRQAQQ